jgi:hypothetical protein
MHKHTPVAQYQQFRNGAKLAVADLFAVHVVKLLQVCVAGLLG